MVAPQALCIPPHCAEASYVAPPHQLSPPKGVKIPQSDYWQLAWGDEFDSCPDGRPDKKIWDHEYGFVRNDELQYYREENAECTDDGVLRITSRHHHDGLENPHFERVSQYPRCQVPAAERPWFCEVLASGSWPK